VSRALFLYGTGQVIGSRVYSEAGSDDTAVPVVGPTYSVPFYSTGSRIFNTMTAQHVTLPDPNQALALWIGYDGGRGPHAVASTSTSGILAPTLLLADSGSGTAPATSGSWRPTIVRSGSARISPGWVVVTNNSGVDVIVDPATRQEATGLDPATMLLIKDKTATVAHADADNLVIETTAGLVHLPTEAVCR
jgi:hypothetical protein